ncbi:hypothetical protein [Streptomyces sp. NPDC049944]|uniref:hypothetical protein n=1 Tax=Streptomyces sp. NPDC049944 TaxID=3155657 RepID=UPI00342B5115
MGQFGGGGVGLFSVHGAQGGHGVDAARALVCDGFGAVFRVSGQAEGGRGRLEDGSYAGGGQSGVALEEEGCDACDVG